jgi:hypothetical protein
MNWWQIGLAILGGVLLLRLILPGLAFFVARAIAYGLLEGRRDWRRQAFKENEKHGNKKCQGQAEGKDVGSTAPR